MTVLSMEQIELLTARTGLIRALAAQLVADPDLADDVAQEAALAALQPRRAVRKDRAWLAGVVRNVAANLRRRSGRRARAEGDSAPAEPASGAADTVALVEQQRLLADAVLGLDAPFRDVVLLRFYEELPQREIARRLQIPVATVNSRLQRALAKLRGRLDHVHGGDRTAWVAALAPIALPLAARDLAFGAVLMKKKTAAAAAVLVAMFGGLGWMALDGSGDERTTEPLGPMVVEAASEVEISPPSAPISVQPVDRVAVVPEPPVSAEDGLVVRVVDGATGEPVPSAEVSVFDLSRLREPRLVAAQHRLQISGGDVNGMPFEIGPLLPLDASARCVVANQGPSAQVFARAPGRQGMLRLRPEHYTERKPVTLRLWPLHTARVRVVDGDSRPMPGVPVGLRAKMGTVLVPVGMCRTGAPNGVAELSWYRGMLGGGLPGQLRLEAFLALPLVEGVSHALDESGTDSSTEPQELTLVCPDVGTVQVVVTAGGEPAPDGTLVMLNVPHEEGALPIAAETVAGTAKLWPVGLQTTLQASAQLLPQVAPASATGDGPRTAGETVILALASDARLVTVVGRAVERDRQPLADTELEVRLTGGTAQSESVLVTTDAEGRFSQPFSVAPPETTGRRLEARVHTRGPEFGERPLGELAGQAVVDIGDLLMPVDLPVVEGTVVDSTGRPLEGVRIWLVERSTDTSNGWAHAQAEYIPPTTDADGRFAIYSTTDTLAEAELGLHAQAHGSWRHDPLPIVSGTSGIRLVMHPAGVLEGRLLVDSGVPLDRVYIELWPESRGEPNPSRGAPITHTADADGELRFSGLEPDSYTVVVTMGYRREIARITGVAVWPGKTTTDPRLLPLDLRGRLRVFSVRVRNEQGEPLRANVYARGGNERWYLGQSSWPLVLGSGDVVDRLIVEHGGYFPARVAPVGEERVDVVLRRGTPVTVRVSGAPVLEKPYSLLVALDPVEGRPRRFRQRWQPDHATLPSTSEVELRVPSSGVYRARVMVERNHDGIHAGKDVTPQPAPQLRVAEGIAGSLTLELDPAAVQRVVQAMER